MTTKRTDQFGLCRWERSPAESAAISRILLSELPEPFAALLDVLPHEAAAFRPSSSVRSIQAWRVAHCGSWSHIDPRRIPSPRFRSVNGGFPPNATARCAIQRFRFDVQKASCSHARAASTVVNTRAFFA